MLTIILSRKARVSSSQEEAGIRRVTWKVPEATLWRGCALGRSTGEYQVRCGNAPLREGQPPTRARRRWCLQQRPPQQFKPFIYLSAGVTDEIRETLEAGAEAGTPAPGVLCGRATRRCYPRVCEGRWRRWRVGLGDRGVQTIKVAKYSACQGCQALVDILWQQENIEVA